MSDEDDSRMEATGVEAAGAADGAVEDRAPRNQAEENGFRDARQFSSRARG